LFEAVRWLGRRFARVVTRVILRRPTLWPLFRGLLRLQFEHLAPHWDSLRPPDHLAAYEAALESVGVAPARALDLGTGTGAGAFAIARRFPAARVVGVDLAERMLAEARSKTPLELAGRVEFAVADASALPFPDGEFELIGMGNMFAFWDELARVTAPGGHVLFAFSHGPQTPMYVPFPRAREELARRDFVEFAEFGTGEGTALLARKRPAG
jgi:SAM-dependent methyltransferase